MKMKTAKNADAGCCTKPALKERPLLSPIQAGGLAAVFKVLANDTRLRLLHALVRAGEMCVTDLASSVGMKPQAVSNQLQRLSDLGILASRRDGNNIHYRVVDLCVRSLMDQALCLMEEVSGRAGVTNRAADCCGVEGRAEGHG
jgi:ArsR family transcriptional regulator, lead/cadmium/zinc/bismuth-responsive transcriptional repressor